VEDAGDCIYLFSTANGKKTDHCIGDGSQGLSEATLRIPVDYADYKGELLRAFGTLFPLYGRGYFFMLVTANMILEGLDGR
jgi:hypothetical protein